MALIDCAIPGKAVGVAPVKNTPWQIRLKAAGLTQKRLAAMLGAAENTVSRQMKGDWAVPGYVEAVVTAWEVMSDDQRADWLWRLERSKGKGEHG